MYQWAFVGVEVSEVFAAVLGIWSTGNWEEGVILAKGGMGRWGYVDISLFSQPTLS